MTRLNSQARPLPEVDYFHSRHTAGDQCPASTPSTLLEGGLLSGGDSGEELIAEGVG